MSQQLQDGSRPGIQLAGLGTSNLRPGLPPSRNPFHKRYQLPINECTSQGLVISRQCPGRLVRPGETNSVQSDLALSEAAALSNCK